MAGGLEVGAYRAWYSWMAAAFLHAHWFNLRWMNPEMRKAIGWRDGWYDEDGWPSESKWMVRGLRAAPLRQRAKARRKAR